MLSTTSPPRVSHDQHLRNLLDQRAARSDFHARSRFTPSEFSDSPSVYSRAMFSPEPVEDHDTEPTFLESPHRSYRTPHSPGASSQRAANPAASMLDFSDDYRSSFASSVDGEIESHVPSSSSYIDDDEDEPLSRMSLLGPKMRFHSRAPWESGDPDNGDEDFDDPFHVDTGLLDSRKNLHPKKIFHLRSPSNSTRPSFDSGRSQDAPGRHSFETDATSHLSHPRGALYALAQESLSTASLHSGSSRGGHGKYTVNQIRHNPSGAYHENRPYSPECDEAVHPYANPDLVHSYNKPQNPSPPTMPFVSSRSNSVATVTGSFGGDLRQNHRPNTGSNTLMVEPKPRTSSIQRREISSPRAVQSSVGHDMPHSPLNHSAPIPGWTDTGAPPSFALISLEEARAQRSRTTTAQGPQHTDPIAIPFPEHDDDLMNAWNHSPPGSMTSNRVRSVSAGAKAKHAFQTMVGAALSKPDRRESEPTVVQPPANGVAAPKNLRHKKSGFMRLFNPARDKERDDKAPPVPSLPDVHIHRGTNFATVHPVQSLPSHPVPPRDEQGIPEPPSMSNSRRIPPNLSINTLTPVHVPQRPASAVPGASALYSPLLPPQRTWEGGSCPQSAPANVTEFPPLRLRPVSALFSAHFTDHIVENGGRPSLEADLGTPRSNSPTAIASPVTPNSSSRFDPPPSGDKLPHANHPPTIRALEEQIVSAKLAWQRQIWELEGQVRDLKAEVEELRATGDDVHYCEACGRGNSKPTATTTGARHADPSNKVVNRPRARTGTSSRFASATS